MVNLRVTAIGMMPALPWPRPGARLPAQPLATRRVLLPGCEQREAPIYRFDDLAPGQRLSAPAVVEYAGSTRSEEHTSELQSLMRISYAVFCLKKKKQQQTKNNTTETRNGM